MENSTTNFIENSKIITDKLSLRETYRQQECDRKRKEKDSMTAETEQSSYFKKTLSEKRAEIDSALSSLTVDCLDKTQLPLQLDKINKDLISLQRYIAASTLFLKVYDVRRSQEIIDALNQKFQEVETELLPKKKFGFKTRKPNVVNMIKEISDTIDSPQETKVLISKVISNSYNLNDNNFGFSNKKGENLILSKETISKKDISLTNLEDCTVQLLGPSSTLTLIALKNCRIFAGPVATSVFVENCSECTFLVPCQQLRIHDTKHTNFYIHVTSRAIIEDTTQVQFAPYNWSYPDLELHFQEAGLDPNRNHWDMIDDFNWLAIDKPSPNWCLLKVDDRVTDWKLLQEVL